MFWGTAITVFQLQHNKMHRSQKQIEEMPSRFFFLGKEGGGWGGRMLKMFRWRDAFAADDDDDDNDDDDDDDDDDCCCCCFSSSFFFGEWEGGVVDTRMTPEFVHVNRMGQIVTVVSYSFKDQAENTRPSNWMKKIVIIIIIIIWLLVVLFSFQNIVETFSTSHLLSLPSL